MSNKEQAIRHLHQARVSMVKWVGMVKLLSADLPVKNYEFNLNLLDTEFGRWFYEEAMRFASTNCADILDNMEDVLVKMHHEFGSLYELCVLNRKKGLLGGKKALGSVEKNLAATHYQEIVRLSDEFQKLLRHFERVFSAKSEDEFPEIFSATSVEEVTVPPKTLEKDSHVGGARGAYHG